jgi:hypothetical protein
MFQLGHLEVVIPPDILSEGSSDDGTALEGGSVRLRCKATGLPDPSVVWRREDSRNIILRHETGREKQGTCFNFIINMLIIIRSYYLCLKIIYK